MSRRRRLVAMALALLVLSGSCAGDEGGDDQAAAAQAEDRWLLDRFVDSGASGLRTAETGQPWHAVGGRWSVRAGTAMGEAPETTTVLSTDPGGPVRYLRVVVGRTVRDSGVVFRYANPFNYWALLAYPEGGEWHLVKVVDGVDTQVDRTEPAWATRGAVVVVRLDGDRIDIEIDGTPVAAAEDPTLADMNAVGFVVPRGERAGFDEILASNRPGRPAPGPGEGPTGPDPRPVLLAGDSVMSELSHPLTYALDAAGGAPYAGFCVCPVIPKDDPTRRIWAQVLDRYSPRVVVVQVGHWEVADLSLRLDPGTWLDPEAYRRDELEPFVDFLQAHGVRRIVWMAPMDVSFAWETALTDVLEAQYDALAADDPAVTIVDPDDWVGPGFREESVDPTGETVPLRRADGRHLCPYGQVLVAQALIDQIEALQGIRAPDDWARDWVATQRPEPNGCAAAFQG